MVFHFIAILNNYTKGMRIAWHYASEEKLDKNRIKVFMKKVEQKCGDVQLGIHKLSTQSMDWSSVVEKDSFFSDVLVTRNVKDFINITSEDKQLTAYDISKFILSIEPVSHLKLQKLLYYAYAEYLLGTGKRLFPEPIVAFKYGPVIEDIFYRFNHNKALPIDFKEDETFIFHMSELSLTPTFAKIVTSENGTVVASYLVNVIEEYLDYDAMELVNMTHREEGPWDRVYVAGKNHQISDDLIKKYHQIVQ
ncbi:Panacea domain-containing protein [Paenibacillus kandeliae]|uniref:Panacea domain-containing protein n=1 Tax=Paenibacillus kandeliae TaxID=3231269 RepID=UPI003458E34A